jgi:hypothetical protein
MWLNFAELQIDKAATRQTQRGPVSAASDIVRQVNIENAMSLTRFASPPILKFCQLTRYAHPSGCLQQSFSAKLRFCPPVQSLFLKNSSEFRREGFDVCAGDGDAMEET